MKRRRIAAVTAGVVIVALGITWMAWPREAEAAYVVAPASRGTITQQVTLIGPVERETQASASFDTPGTVMSVSVKLGDHVNAGDTIATVDPAPLRLAVLTARATVAQAEAQLDADLTAQENGTTSTEVSSSTTTGTTTSSSSASSGSFGSLSGLTGTGTTPAYITDLNTSLAALQKAVTHQEKVCAPVFEQLQVLSDLGESVTLPTAVPTVPATPSPTPTGTPAVTPSVTPTATASPTTTASSSATATASATASPTGSASPTPSATPTPTSTPTSPITVPTALPTDWPTALPTDPAALSDLVDGFTACSTSMGKTAQAEATAGAAIGTATQAMAEANQAAAAALIQAQSELAAAAAQAQEAAIAAAQQAIADQIAAMSGGAVTDATIKQDRATLLQARQSLDSAESNLAAGTLTAPVSGTVGALDFVAGESSAGASATIVGAGAARITVNVPLTDRPLVAPGTAAQVGQLAADPALSGQVSTVSVLPSSSATPPTYATEILCDDPDRLLNSGSTAQVTLALSTASDVLTVPASAVTMITDTTGTVEVVDSARATTAETVTVVVGGQGEGRAEIVSGLNDGQLVVLADRRLPIPGGLEQYSGAGGDSTPTPTP